MNIQEKILYLHESLWGGNAFVRLRCQFLSFCSSQVSVDTLTLGLMVYASILDAEDDHLRIDVIYTTVLMMQVRILTPLDVQAPLDDSDQSSP